MCFCLFFLFFFSVVPSEISDSQLEDEYEQLMKELETEENVKQAEQKTTTQTIETTTNQSSTTTQQTLDNNEQIQQTEVII